MKFNIKSVILYGSVIIVISWALSAFIIIKMYPSAEAHGTFGDLFGAINALFSGFAFLGVIVAILLQKEELEEQRREIKESRIAQNKSAVALGKQTRISGLMARLDATNHVLASVDRQINRTSTAGRYDSSTKVKNLIEKQEKYEVLVEKLLAKIEKLEEENNDSPE